MDRKRVAEGSSSSGRATYSASSRAPVYAQYRSESPPASAYFSHFSGDHHEEPQPTRPDANAHFAYSTTLRRHTLDGPLGIQTAPLGSSIPSLGELRGALETEGVKGVWDRTGGRLIAAFTNQRDDYERLPTHREEGHVQKESMSARFAHYSVQVRLRLEYVSLGPVARALSVSKHTYISTLSCVLSSSSLCRALGPRHFAQQPRPYA